MPDLDPDLIRSRLSLRTLAEEAGAIFNRPHGVGTSSCCPLHGGDNPTAFHLYADETRWHCFTNCPHNANDGDIFTFYMRWRGVDFKTALQELSSRTSVSSCSLKIDNRLLTIDNSPISISPIPSPPGPTWRARAESFITFAHDQLLHPKIGARARAYLLTERGLQPETWDVFRLGLNPHDIYDSPSLWGFNDDDKNIWLPRGIVIPGIKDSTPWYIKIRRPLPNDSLGKYILPKSCHPEVYSECSEGPDEGSPGPKFMGVKGNKSTLFGTDLWTGHQTLILTEGEWDCMLSWQLVSDLADFATLGGASKRASFIDLTALTRYPQVLAIYDADTAGENARQYLSSIPRIHSLSPPAHDLTDYFRVGGDMRSWITSNIPDYEN